MTAVGLIQAMVAQYVANSRLITTNPEIHSWKQAGAAGMLIHAVMAAYGEDYETATERVADMITDVTDGMD